MSGTILIVDDVATNRIVLKVKLAAACYTTLQAACGQSALSAARRAQPDLILLDVMLPDLSGIEVCRRLKADPETRDIPVVMITASRSPAAGTEALRAGADDFMPKPVEETILMARIRSLLRARETEAELRLRDGTRRALGLAEAAVPFAGPDGPAGQRARGQVAARGGPGAGRAMTGAEAGCIALIGPDRETAMAWRRALAPHLAARLVVVPAETALAETTEAPDVYLIAADLARPGAGLRLMSELRSRAATRHSAVCILLPDALPGGATPADLAAMALDLGAADLLSAGYGAEETALRLAAQLRRKRQADRLRDSVQSGLRLAVIDPLTGLYNRRYALPHLARMAERAAASGRRYAVMLLDLDRFKAVNDSFGHAAGDAVLAEVAQRLRASLRPVDLIARIGGEEFLVAMPDATLATARATAERLCRVIEAQPVALPPTAQLAVAGARAAATGGPLGGAPIAGGLPGAAGHGGAGIGGAGHGGAGHGNSGPGGAGVCGGGLGTQGIGHGGGAAVSVTVSIGLALGGVDPRRPGDAPETPAAVMAHADAALLAAKAEGRNQVTVGRSAA